MPSRKKMPPRGKKKIRKGLLSPIVKVLKVEFPNQSEHGKCEIRVTKAGGLWCENSGCDGECHLFSIPNNNPRARQKDEGVFNERNPFDPDPKRYYFCRCVERVRA